MGDAKLTVPAALYWQSRLLKSTAGLWQRLANLETSVVADELAAVQVKAPIYVTSLARAGTTIVTELLNQHPDTTSHQYSDFPWVWTPYWRNYLRQRSQIAKPETSERAHKDRIMISADSPEAAEEIIWSYFFKNSHIPEVSNVLDQHTSKPAFEKFYAEHQRKLLLVRKASRYLAKGNYNISRLAYIHKLYPDAKFIIPVRNPVNHIASLAKQHQFFNQAAKVVPRVGEQLQLAGHWEFGPGRKAANFGDNLATAEINAAWECGDEITGWAMLWNNTYKHLLKQLAAQPELTKACHLFRYEDLCLNSKQITNEIISHCDLASEPFTEIAEQFCRKLSLPDYYQPEFSQAELETINTICGETANRLGY